MNLRNLHTLIVLSFLIFSCGKKEDESEVPENLPVYVLAKEKYVKLLVDMALAEAVTNTNVKAYASNQFDSVYAFQPLKENGIDKATYDSTLSFYSRHPKMFKALYEEVLSELSKLQTRKIEGQKDTTAVDRLVK